MDTYSVPMDTRSLSEVIGTNARAARDDRGLTLSDVVRELRNLGVTWSPGWLSDIENGRFSPSLKVVCLLALALTEASKDNHVTPLQLLETDTPVELGEQLALTPHGFQRLLSGELDALTVGDVVGGVEELGAIMSASKEKRDEVAAGFRRASSASQGEPTRGEVKAAQRAFSLADANAAKKLGVTESTFVGASLALWGRLMSQETDARAPEDATAQKRGHISRGLIAELREHLG